MPHRDTSEAIQPDINYRSQIKGGKSRLQIPHRNTSVAFKQSINPDSKYHTGTQA